jgi:hypothetical protein
MSPGEWKNLEADVRKALRIGEENGETVIDVVTRILWLERHKNHTRIQAMSEMLRVATGDPMLVRKVLVKAVNVVEWRESAD